ncbi:MAG TPA: succinate dehydrogenase, cytochrome b556 subunit [Thermoflexales bacterium]|nr:succinate dehydrogenase, cytochrome b556 subunit [Thermoflexales bacterium]HQW35709.1 succinate dehydrogenase, cytochrome b556 subunit [Thermoflexales bacterium]HQZ22979.1 succinate dehydrogenase, cytochrome b556 subunit [Thermoflexales bacterium]HRA00475.1 succinate dehydrogenase, cytochrome b556 subunit [Thermoflexales bacterium]
MYKNTGFISFVLRRFTGVFLVIYLAMHMFVIGSVNLGPAAFDARLALVQTNVFKILEIGLLAAVVYHAFDGVRLLMVHYFHLTNQRQSLFYAAFAIAALLTVAGGIPIILFAINGG